MDNVCLVVPVLEGKEESARAFLSELDSGRSSAYRSSQQRIGIDKEVWFIAPQNGTPTLIAYIEAPSFEAAVGAFAGSDEEFDQWFKGELAACTGLDLNDPPPLELPEVLSTFAS